jgi:hypothetical protein
VIVGNENLHDRSSSPALPVFVRISRFAPLPIIPLQDFNTFDAAHRKKV